MKYAFFPGCVLESAAKEDYLATVAVAKKLGIELEELDGWTCCGASHVQTFFFCQCNVTCICS